MIVPVILSGGSGKRLWPLSRTLFPKQFINLISDTTPFQDTILRLPEDISDPLVICNDADIDNAVEWAVLSAFSNAGQRCASASRIIIESIC